MSDKPKLTPDEAAAFRAAVKDVREYKQPPPLVDAGIQASKRPTRPGAKTAISTHDTASYRDFLSEEPRHEAVEGDEALLFVRDGIQQRQFKRLRQGGIRPALTLDLHGYSAEQARLHLGEFLEQAQALRCVCVIHGKGRSSQQRQPVLKNLVNSWLRQHPAVLAFCSASAKDGGTGAVYVLLKRDTLAD